MTSPFQLLILDYGGVYSFEYPADSFETIFRNVFGRVPDQAERNLIIQSSQALSKNSITTQEHIETVGSIMHISPLPTVEQFEKITIDVTYPPTPEMVDMVARVRKSGRKVALLSDMYMFEVRHTQSWGRYDGFDHVLFSAKEGMTKQDPRIFNKVLSHFNTNAPGALFVDDTISNIEVAQSAGLTALHADKQTYPRVGDLIDRIYELLEIETEESDLPRS